MALIDGSVPEHDAHVVALWFAEGEDKGLRKIAPHVVRLDVGEQYVGVYR